MRRQIENEIRDKLIDRLHIFDEDLTYLQKEKYLPNPLGTRGFVDLLATDSQNRFVVIELKRSKAASREAIHEVLKYIEGIKLSKSLKDDEIIAYIVSTEWKELIVPFSIFTKDTPFEINGYRLSIDENNNPISAEKVIPLSLNNERLFSDYHAVALYKSKENLLKGLKSIEQSYSKKNIKDYVILECSHTSKVNDSDTNVSKESTYSHMLYYAIEVMHEEQYWKIIQQDEQVYSELKGFHLTCNSKKERNLALHNAALYEIKPTEYMDRGEIGYPAKLTAIIKEEYWTIERIIRGGKVLKNELLTDKMIIEELRGSSGTNNVKYVKGFNSGSRSSFQQILKEIPICLADNPYWQTGTKKAIKELIRLAEKKKFTGDVQVFNPMNTLLSIYFNKFKECPDGEELCYFPSYDISATGKGFDILYYGCFSFSERADSLKKLIRVFFEDEESNLIRTQGWGGYLKQDCDICDRLGLEYSNYRLEVKGVEFNPATNLYDKILSYSKFNGYKYIPCSPTHPTKGVSEFLKKESDFCEGVTSLFSKHALGNGYFIF